MAAHTDAYPSLEAMREGTAPPGTPGTPPELLSFSDWAAVLAEARDIAEASPYLNDPEFRYVWPKVRDRLSRCGVLIGPSGIEIRPYHPPTALNPGYSRARQRIYMSATLGPMDELQRRIGGSKVTRLVPAAPLPPGATGERLLVLNPGPEQPSEASVLDWALDQVTAAGGRAAWLCASHAEADALQAQLTALGHPVYRLRPGDDDMVDTWKGAADGQLITAGRYDGLDLSGDICRLVIITTVPQASSEFERFVVAYLGDASYMRHRVGQRVTQALGRANRTRTDRSMYLGPDPMFAQILANPAVRASIPESTRATIRSALELYDQGWPATTAACAAFWTAPASAPRTATAGTDSGPARPRRKARSGRGTATDREPTSADAEVRAATDLWIGDQDAAAASARKAAALLAAAEETEHAAFWQYVEAHALFDRGREQDLAAARQALENATANGPRTTWFRRLSRAAADLSGHDEPADDTDRLFLSWDEWHREAGARLDHALSDGRTLLTGSHDQQCDGLKLLARLAGASGDRPPKSEQSATDCRWTWSTIRRAERRVWEVKTKQRPLIAREDINQLLGQIEVETRRAPKSRVYGCLLAPATVAADGAAEAAGDKITLVSREAAIRLYDMLAERLRHYAALSGDGSAQARGHARSKTEDLLPPDGWLSRLLTPTRGKVMVAEDIARLF